MMSVGGYSFTLLFILGQSIVLVITLLTQLTQSTMYNHQQEIEKISHNIQNAKTFMELMYWLGQYNTKFPQGLYICEL